MLKNLAQFKLDLLNFKNITVPNRVLGLVKGMANSIYIDLTQKDISPVDTGWSRANWGVFVGTKPPVKYVGKYPEDLQRKGTPIPFDTYYKNQRAVIDGTKIGQIVWIFNNAPYIVALEEGHSKAQAPQGMLQIALYNMQAKINLGVI